jgi:hypothetical protein
MVTTEEHVQFMVKRINPCIASRKIAGSNILLWLIWVLVGYSKLLLCSTGTPKNTHMI